MASGAQGLWGRCLGIELERGRLLACRGRRGSASRARSSMALLRRRGEAGASGWRGRVARWLGSALLALDSRKVAAGRVFGHLVRSE